MSVNSQMLRAKGMPGWGGGQGGVVWVRVVDCSEPSKQSKCKEQAESGVEKEHEVLTHANLAVCFKDTS